jgi:hypothetical protein
MLLQPASFRAHDSRSIGNLLRHIIVWGGPSAQVLIRRNNLERKTVTWHLKGKISKCKLLQSNLATRPPKLDRAFRFTRRKMQQHAIGRKHRNSNVNNTANSLLDLKGIINNRDG